MRSRQQLIYRLHKLRNKGWEAHILPYGLPFNEQEASFQQLQQHVRKIEQFRSTYYHNILTVAIRFIAILIILLVILFSHI